MNLKSRLEDKNGECKAQAEQLLNATKEREKVEDELSELRKEFEQLQARYLDLDLVSKDDHFQDTSFLQKESSERQENDQEIFAK